MYPFAAFISECDGSLEISQTHCTPVTIIHFRRGVAAYSPHAAHVRLRNHRPTAVGQTIGNSRWPTILQLEALVAARQTWRGGGGAFVEGYCYQDKADGIASGDDQAGA